MIDRGDPNAVSVTCDGCGHRQTYSVDVLFQGGLRGQGWACDGGTQVCAPCAHRAPADAPAAVDTTLARTVVSQ